MHKFSRLSRNEPANDRARPSPDQPAGVHPPLKDFTERLRGKSRKMTGPRIAILEVLRREPHPASPKEIHAALPAGQCDLATVYRSVNLLESMEMVKRYDFGDGVARFELLRHGHNEHHHHLVCTSCSHVIELQECLVEEVEQRIASASGFRAITHKLEFFGICPACQ